ncbi:MULTISPECIES: Fic family protein [unclassified Pseudomonas]|uniref:Fic family protein n=1 Tax=unclassified Pseudomonas TaxID=196821 RepID=UPI00119ACF2C|nr:MULTISPECIES: Fic family protein [unclassified Pseudomonas]TWC06413.1 Fic/DOC family protein [Pseudomonas sp. SJZ075]TWC10918.1 Fic/DOC family protein [Pseudomonas sp. SJZ074]TWC25039.1 Fic/DOC family protein [Pseudomonas sp. SJZ078]TWC29110.1 Fic/DOC family protein [Pseudomonas sp. SJZ085]TWC44087.1 Fic/DOC family protein [Pseudomonas sp. SJZ124]
MNSAGYAWLQDALQLSVFPLRQPARVQPVTRLERIGDTLAVPPGIAPGPDDLLGHVLFALKHEGINLAILAQALPQISLDAFEAELKDAPNGIYIRKACFLREAFTGDEVAQSSPVKGSFIPLFDPEQYLTMPGERSSRWRVEFNGIGTLAYCATVERTPQVMELLQHNILERAQAFIRGLPSGMMDRAINWAYLHETQDSFAIEKESPSEDKSRRFIQLLRQAHERIPLSEDYLVALQNATISNPYDKAAAFRHEQNHLANGLQGAAGVTYVPPAPDLCRELMEQLMALGNEATAHIDPLVAAGIISFGFVFLHPFMDGNGRLSRFLVHQTLCRAGALEHGLLLPVSVAMKREERLYLETLQEFSRPAREFWNVRWIDQGNLSFDFTGHPAIYRFWDATSCVRFTLEMAKRALEVELREETVFLENYDRIVKAVDERYDVRGSDLSNLAMMCLAQNGVVSKHRRKQYKYSVQEEVFDFIEQVAQTLLREQEKLRVERADQ